MNKLHVLVLSLLALAGCDIVEQPKGDLAPPTLGGSTVTRNVLLEDCTGHLCAYCPQAAVIAEDLKSIYGDRLVVVAVHMTSTFAAPQPPIGDGIYDTDFRTEAGNAYEQQFAPNGLPKGLINRTPYNNNITISRGSWSSAVAQLIDLPAAVNLWFDTLHFDPNTNTVSGTIKAAILQQLPTTQNLTIYLTENHIIDWQLNDQENVPDYEFNYVLRGALNGPWGEAFISADAQPGDTLERTFSYPLPAQGAPNQVLNPDNCSLVAYVYNSSGSTLYEVQQVTERQFNE